MKTNTSCFKRVESWVKNRDKKWCKKLALSLLMTSVVSGCSSTGTSNTGASKQNNPNGLMLKLSTKSSDSLFWTGYGMGMMACSSMHQVGSFGQFYCAFSLAENIGSSIDEGGIRPPTQFSKDLKKITKAGYFREYAYHSYHNETWFAEPGLKTAEFKQWMSAQLPNHVVPQLGAQANGTLELPKQRAVVELDGLYIKRTGSLELINKHVFEDTTHGIKLRYEDSEHADFYADVYVYPKTQFEKSDKERFDNKTNERPELYLIDEMSTVKAGILYYVNQGTYNNFKVLSEQLSEDGNVAYGVYQLEQNYQAMQSSALLTEHQGVLIKVRSSHAVTNNTDYQQYIDNIVEDLKKHTRLVRNK